MPKDQNVSEAALAALQRAAQLAASVAEANAVGGGQDGEEVEDPNKSKKDQKLANAKQKSRQGHLAL